MTPIFQYSPEVQAWLEKASSRERPYGAAPIGHGLWLLSAVTQHADCTEPHKRIHGRGFLWLKLVNPTVRQPPGITVVARYLDGTRIRWAPTEEADGDRVHCVRSSPQKNPNDRFASEDDFSFAFEFASEGLCTIASCSVRGMTAGPEARSTFSVAPAPSSSVSLQLLQIEPNPGESMSNIATRHYNPARLQQVADLLAIEHDKLFAFEKEIAMTSGNEQIILRQRLKHQLVPRIQDLEKEFVGLAVAGLLNKDIPEDKAADAVRELSRAVSSVRQQMVQGTPPELERLLKDTDQKLSKREEAATAKLKLTLPIIPMICAYEVQIDTVKAIRAAWAKTCELISHLLKGGDAPGLGGG